MVMIIYRHLLRGENLLVPVPPINREDVIPELQLQRHTKIADLLENNVFASFCHDLSPFQFEIN